MYCDKCGKEIKPEWRNCPSCGAALHENAVELIGPMFQADQGMSLLQTI